MNETTDALTAIGVALGPSGVGPDPGARDPLRLALQGLLAGFEVMIPDGTSLPTLQGPLTKEQVVADLTAALAVYSQLDAHRRAVTQALQEIADASAANRRRTQQLKDLLLGYYGRGDPRLGQFGMRSRASPRPLTPEAKVLRAQRVRDTRALRHTLGRRQKAAIKGEGRYTLVVGPSPEPATPPPHAPLDAKTASG